MMWLEPVLPHAAPFLLVVFRVAGVFVLTPLLSSSNVPAQARIMIAISLAAAVYPALELDPATIPELDLVSLVPLMVTEVMIGVVIGLLASLPLIFLQMGGYIMGYQMGLALAQAYNPELDTQSGVIGQLLFFMGMAAFVAIGGLDVVFIAILETFKTVPVGVFAGDVMPLELLVDLLHTGFGFALRIASPIIAVVTMILISMGFVMKTMPQINIMSFGFAAKIASGILTLATLVFVIDQVSGELMEDVLSAVLSWARSIGGA